MSIQTQFKFINFVKVDTLPARLKTEKWSCRNNKSGDELGLVMWYGVWRQYCYFPSGPGVYSAGCLSDIETFIAELVGERLNAEFDRMMNGGKP